jgi:hypothetical protein
MPSAWRKVATLTGAERRLLAESVVLLGLTRIALWLLPFPQVRRALDWYGGRDAAAPRLSSSKIAWAVRAGARRLPSMSCLVQSLTAHALLRKHAHHPKLRIGVRETGPPAARSLEAHAWVECEGRVVVGEIAELADYAMLGPRRQP